jgi:hypothetical protein
VLAAKQDQDLFKMIRDGKDKMPSEASNRAKDDEVWAMIYYIRSMSSQTPAAPAAAAPASN